MTNIPKVNTPYKVKKYNNIFLLYKGNENRINNEMEHIHYNKGIYKVNFIKFYKEQKYILIGFGGEGLMSGGEGFKIRINNIDSFPEVEKYFINKSDLYKYAEYLV